MNLTALKSMAGRLLIPPTKINKKNPTLAPNFAVSFFEQLMGLSM